MGPHWEEIKFRTGPGVLKNQLGINCQSRARVPLAKGFNKVKRYQGLIKVTRLAPWPQRNYLTGAFFLSK